MSSSWRNVLLQSHEDLDRAIQVIEAGSLRIALVIDEHGHLLGTVTDGDIRRALLRHLPMSTQVAEVMNPKPKTADVDTPRIKLLSMMQTSDLLSIPLVKDGVLVGLETLQHTVLAQQHENPVFIMAGGFGTRLRPLTENCPKPMLHVGGKPMLETTLEHFIEQGFSRFFISTHYMPDQIKAHFGDGKKWGAEIRYVHEETPLGTGGALGLLPRDLPDMPLIMINGDVLTTVDFGDLLSFHRQSGAIATMCVREYEFQIPYGVVYADKGKIHRMVEKPKLKNFVNAGIYAIDRELVDRVRHNEVVDMPTLLEREIKKQSEVSMFPVYEYWMDIGRMDDFQRAQQEISGLK